jgi:hypothetical protein
METKEIPVEIEGPKEVEKEEEKFELEPKENPVESLKLEFKNQPLDIVKPTE